MTSACPCIAANISAVRPLPSTAFTSTPAAHSIAALLATLSRRWNAMRCRQGCPRDDGSRSASSLRSTAPRRPQLREGSGPQSKRRKLDELVDEACKGQGPLIENMQGHLLKAQVACRAVELVKKHTVMRTTKSIDACAVFVALSQDGRNFLLSGADLDLGQKLHLVLERSGLAPQPPQPPVQAPEDNRVNNGLEQEPLSPTQRGARRGCWAGIHRRGTGTAAGAVGSVAQGPGERLRPSSSECQGATGARPTPRPHRTPPLAHVLRVV